MSSLATDIIELHWNKQLSLPRSKGATAGEIAEFQAKHGVSMPADFVTYISRLNGLAIPKDPNSWENVDAEGFEFYPLSEISLSSECPGYYVFCYWSLGLLPYAICLSHTERNGEIVTLRGTPQSPYFVASDFSSFAELYVQDSPQLYEPGARVPQQ